MEPQLDPPAELDGVAFGLGEYMSSISEEVYCAGWLIGTEWVLWRALLTWRDTGEAYWSPDSDFPDNITRFMPALDALQKAAVGWVWWRDGRRFVPEERWLRLFDAWSAKPASLRWGIDNAQIDAEVPDVP